MFWIWCWTAWEMFTKKNTTIFQHSSLDKNDTEVKTHVEIDVKDFVLGELVVMLMNKFTRTKNKVINKPILPGATSWGITKFIYKKYFATNIMIWSQLVYTLSYRRDCVNCRGCCKLWKFFLRWFWLLIKQGWYF